MTRSKYFWLLCYNTQNHPLKKDLAINWKSWWNCHRIFRDGNIRWLHVPAGSQAPGIFFGPWNQHLSMGQLRRYQDHNVAPAICVDISSCWLLVRCLYLTILTPRCRRIEIANDFPVVHCRTMLNLNRLYQLIWDWSNWTTSRWSEDRWAASTFDSRSSLEPAWDWTKRSELTEGSTRKSSWTASGSNTSGWAPRWPQTAWRCMIWSAKRRSSCHATAHLPLCRRENKPSCVVTSARQGGHDLKGEERPVLQDLHTFFPTFFLMASTKLSRCQLSSARSSRLQINCRLWWEDCTGLGQSEGGQKGCGKVSLIKRQMYEWIE